MRNMIMDLYVEALRGLERRKRLAPAEWSVEVRPTWVEFSGWLRDDTDPAKVAGALRQWGKAAGLVEVDPPYVGMAQWAGSAGPVVVSVSGVTDPGLYSQRVPFA